MVLKIKIFLLILLVSNKILAHENGEIFYTDKYDANYFSSKNTANTKLYIGSDLFKFFSIESLQTCGTYIDSFLRAENIEFDNNLSIENENRFKVELGSIDAQKCYELSVIWTEKYKIKFQEILLEFIKLQDFDSIRTNTDKIIFRKLIQDEMSRFYNPGNTVNNSNLAFVIPKSLSSNNFKKVFTHYNTKRYSAKESRLLNTEIIYNSKHSPTEIKYIFPSLNRQSFIKNCLSLTIIESLFSEIISFRTDFFINQAITSFNVNSSNMDITDFSVYFNEIELQNNEFNSLKNNAFSKIKDKCSETLFYYSYYDIKKLEAALEKYDLIALNQEINIINERKNFLIEVSPENLFYFNKIKIQDFNLLDFQNGIVYKKNATDFENEEDTLLIGKLKLFMAVNTHYRINLEGSAKRNEYLFIEKFKKDTILNKYSQFGYRVSKRSDLALYRALLIFSELTDAGIQTNRLKCAGRKTKKSEIKLNLFIQD